MKLQPSRKSQSSAVSIALFGLAILGLGACHGHHKGGNSGACVDFNAQTLGTLSNVGTQFTDNGIVVKIQQFQWSNGTWSNTGHGRIDPGVKAGGSGNSLNTNNINARFEFGRVGGITAKFGEYGGNINLKVNGDFKNAANLLALNGTTVGGAHVAVTGGTGSTTGTLTLSGIIEGFEIGGQELWLDDVCSTPAP